MTEKTKYRLILAAKIIFVAAITALHGFNVLYWFYYLIFITGFFSFVIIGAIIIGISELFPKSRKGKNFFIRHVAQPIILTATIFATILIYNAGVEFAEFAKKTHVESFIDDAEAVLQYDMNTHHMDGIDGIDTRHSLIIIDYDRMKAGFLHDSLYNYREYKLEKGVEYENEFVQIRTPVPSPGKEFISYCPDDDSPHRTTAIQLVMEDGTVYGVVNMTDGDKDYPVFLGLYANERILPFGEVDTEDPFR